MRSIINFYIVFLTVNNKFDIVWLLCFLARFQVRHVNNIKVCKILYGIYTHVFKFILMFYSLRIKKLVKKIRKLLFRYKYVSMEMTLNNKRILPHLLQILNI